MADATLSEASAPPPFSAIAWLARHGITHIDRDAVCAKDVAHFAYTGCACYGSLSLTSDPAVDLLVCAYATGGSRGPNSPISEIRRRALYAPDGGRLRLVLNVTVGASTGAEVLPDPHASDKENVEYLSDIALELGVRAEGDRVFLSEQGDEFPLGVYKRPFPCAETVARVGRPGSALDGLSAADIATVKRTYRAICDGPREWRWNGSTLVQVTPLSR